VSSGKSPRLHLLTATFIPRRLGRRVPTLAKIQAFRVFTQAEKAVIAAMAPKAIERGKRRKTLTLSDGAIFTIDRSSWLSAEISVEADCDPAKRRIGAFNGDQFLEWLAPITGHRSIRVRTNAWLGPEGPKAPWDAFSGHAPDDVRWGLGDAALWRDEFLTWWRAISKEERARWRGQHDADGAWERWLDDAPAGDL
jgi:hypothetical protein